MCHLSTEFYENGSSSCCIILLIDDKCQRKHNLLSWYVTDSMALLTCVAPVVWNIPLIFLTSVAECQEGHSACKNFSAISTVLWHCWLGDRKGHLACKCWVMSCCWWFEWSSAQLIAPFVTTTTPSSLALMKLANQGSPIKMAIKMERELFPLGDCEEPDPNIHADSHQVFLQMLQRNRRSCCSARNSTRFARPRHDHSNHAIFAGRNAAGLKCLAVCILR